jgi:methionyl-tRNA formyltransferase
MPAAALERQVRAYLPWPGTFLEVGEERLVVTAASTAPSEPDDVPGRLVVNGDRPALATADGRLVLDAVTPPGRRPMSGADYLRGRRRPA